MHRKPFLFQFVIKIFRKILCCRAKIHFKHRKIFFPKSSQRRWFQRIFFTDETVVKSLTQLFYVMRRIIVPTYGNFTAD